MPFPEYMKEVSLSGPPELGGIEFPYPADEYPFALAWEPEHIMRTYYGGREEVVRRRFRGYFTMGWRSLTASQLRNLLSVLEKKEFSFTPRLRNPDEIDGIFDLSSGFIYSLERAYTVRCVNTLEINRKVRHGNLFEVEVQLKTTEPIGDADEATDSEIPATSTEAKPGGITGDSVCIVFFRYTAATGVPQWAEETEDLTIDLEPIENSDGTALFELTALDPRGYLFWLDPDYEETLVLLSGSPETEKDNDCLVLWKACPLFCQLADPSNVSAGSYSARKIQVQVNVDALREAHGAGEYTLRFALRYDCVNFDMALPDVTIIVPA